MTKIAVVTGAAGGMGKAICTRLLDDGFHVVGVDIAHNKDDDKVGAKAHLRFSAETCDLTDEGAVSALFGRIAAAHGGVDILVNNAGTCFMSDFPDIPATELKAQMAVNFESAFYCCQAAVPLMLERDGVRKIINISSNGAYNFNVFDPVHYRTSKAAMDTLTKDLARRYATRKISVNSLAPAMTKTPLFGLLSEETLAKAIAEMPHGAAMQPAQVASWVGFLAGDGGDISSGNVIVLNQGRDVR